MQPFITYREENDEGVLCYYILQKSFPHYVGVIVGMPIFDAIVNAPLPEYNLYVSYAGCLHGNVVPSYSNSDAERDAIFYAMAEWYYRGGGWYAPYPVYGGWSTWSPPVVVERQPVVVQSLPPGPPPQSLWYYCQNPAGYYPYVSACPGGWTPVPATPAPPPPDR